MKKHFFLLGAAAIFAFGSCNNSSNSKNGNGDSTTTTTTSKVGTRIANFENRSFMNLKTGQPVKLIYDTVNHYYIDAATNQQPNYLFFDPAARDTFDYWGRRLNNALILNDGDYTIDESKVMAQDNTVAPPTDSITNNVAVDTSTTTTTNSTTTTNNGKTKTKQKEDKTKTKTKTDK